MATSKIKQQGWSKLTASGSNAVTVPRTATEATVQVAGLASAITYSFHLTAEMLSQNRGYYGGYGWASGTNSNLCSILVNDYVINSNALYNNAVNELPNATLTVYYR